MTISTIRSSSYRVPGTRRQIISFQRSEQCCFRSMSHLCDLFKDYKVTGRVS